jgi:hypothetical protein
MTAASPAERTRIMHAISNETLKVTYGKPSGSDLTNGEESELMTTARDALALALQPGIGFRVVETHPVYLNGTSWYSREFGERPGVRMYATVLLPDGVWITVDSVDPARTTQWIVRMFRNLAIVDGVMVILCFFAVRLVTRPLSVLASAAEPSAATSTDRRCRTQREQSCALRVHSTSCQDRLRLRRPRVRSSLRVARPEDADHPHALARKCGRRADQAKFTRSR